jgi:hypothetical protein
MPTTGGFDDFGWGEQERPPPLEVPLPLVGSTGTQSEEETGRGVAAGIPTGPRYRIGVFESKGFGSVYCGGALRGKMCVRADCTILAHKKNKAKGLFSLPGFPEEQLVMVYAGPAADRMASVSMTPRLSPLMFGAKLNECLTLTKAHVSWSMVFETISKTGRGQEDDTTVSDVLLMTEQGASFVMSPRSTAVKDHFLPEDVIIPKMEVPPYLGESQDEVVSTLTSLWPALVEHLHELTDVVTAIQEAIRANKSETAAEFDQLDYKIATIKALLGDRAEELGTTTVFSLLVDLSRDSEEGPRLTQAEVSELARRAAVLAATEAAEAVVNAKVFSGSFSRDFITPTMGLLREISDSPTTPGNRWKGRFERLEADAQRSVSSSASPPPSNFSWGQQTSPSAQNASNYEDRMRLLEARMEKYEEGLRDLNRGAYSVQGVATPDVIALRTRVEELAVANQEMRDEASSHSVKMGTVIFTSAMFTHAWAARVCAVDQQPHFLDPISLLSLSDTVKEDEFAASKTRENSTRVQDVSTDHTRLKASFSLEVPPLFGKTSDSSGTRATRALAGVPTYKHWDSGLGYDGVRQKLEIILDDGSARMGQNITQLGNVDTIRVAQQMLTDSRQFWNALILWITTYYTETRNRSNSPPETIWLLVSHCVRVVFAELRHARLSGCSLTSGGMLWGSLQAHRVCKDMMSLRFAGYPKIALILHQHVIDNCTPIAVFNALTKEVEDLKRDNAETRNVANKAMTAAREKKK